MKEIMKSFGVGLVALCAIFVMIVLFVGLIKFFPHIVASIAFFLLCLLIGWEIRNPSTTRWGGPK